MVATAKLTMRKISEGSIATKNAGAGLMAGVGRRSYEGVDVGAGTSRNRFIMRKLLPGQESARVAFTSHIILGNVSHT